MQNLIHLHTNQQRLYLDYLTGYRPKKELLQNKDEME